MPLVGESASHEFHASRAAYERLLEQIAFDRSNSLRAFALYHMAELGIELRTAAAPIEATPGAPGVVHAAQGRLGRMRERALHLIENLPGSTRVPVRSTEARHA